MYKKIKEMKRYRGALSPSITSFDQRSCPGTIRDCLLQQTTVFKTVAMPILPQLHLGIFGFEPKASWSQTRRSTY